MTSNDFPTMGFLGQKARESRQSIIDHNAGWFKLARDLSEELQSLSIYGTEHARDYSTSPKCIATRYLLRSTQTFQAVIIVAQFGMVTEAQILARSLFENAFCVAALAEQPEMFLKLLREDADASRREQAKFLLDRGIAKRHGPEVERQMRELITIIGKKPDFLSPKKVAALGPLLEQYHSYQKLSNDSSHSTAAALFRHVATYNDNASWNYRVGPGKDEEIAFALYQAIFAALPMGIGYSQLMSANDRQERFGPLFSRLEALPRPNGSLTVASASALPDQG